jgi:hypothetical protein
VRKGFKMLRLKSCPRCKGDLLIDRDHISWYEQCFQCGYQHDLDISYEAKGNGKKDIDNVSDRVGLVMEKLK